VHTLIIRLVRLWLDLDKARSETHLVLAMGIGVITLLLGFDHIFDHSGLPLGASVRRFFK